jgi:prepilin-type N-terminal cleavage/methylation domain-containing protein
MRASACRGRGDGGFTLVELMISLAIMGLVMAGLLGLLTASRDAYSRGSSTIEAQQNTRLALDRMGKEIREAGYHPRPPDTSPTCPPGPGSLYPTGGGNSPCWNFYPIVAQTASALTLQYDWNGDGAITTAGKVNDPFDCPTGTAVCRGEQVTYSLSGTTLMRQEVGVDASAQPVATGISAVTFTYLKDDNSTATNREDIRSVQIVIKATTGTSVPATAITMTDQIRLRTR